MDHKKIYDITYEHKGVKWGTAKYYTPSQLKKNIKHPHPKGYGI